MNYTPDKLEKLGFRTSIFGGYNKGDVDGAVRDIVSDYRAKEREILDLEGRIDVMAETVNHYKTIEESMQHCLIIAQHTSDEMVKSADEKAKDILAQADATARKIVDDAHQQANRIKFSYDDMKSKIFSFRVKNEALLKSQLDVLKQMNEEADAPEKP